MSLITLNMEDGLLIGSVSHGSDHSAGPVEVIRGYFAGGVGEVIRSCLDIGIKRHHHIESIGSKGQPLNGFDVIRTVIVNLNQGHKVIAVDADGTVGTPHIAFPVSGIRVVWCSLEVGGEDIFHIFNGDFLFRHHAPWNIVRIWCEICGRAIPAPCARIQAAAHIPCTWGIVDVVGIVMTAKSISWVENAVHSQIQVIFLNKILQICRAHIFFLLGKGIFQVELVDTKLIRHDHIDIIRYFAGYPVMTADGFKPPDFIGILKSNAVHFISAVLFKQAAEALNPFTGTANIRQDQAYNIFLTDTALGFFMSIFRGLINNQWISAKHSWIGSDGFCGCHGHIGFIDAAGCPDTIAFKGVGYSGITHRIVRKVDFHMGKDRYVFAGLLIRVNHHVFLRGKSAGR